MVWGTGFDAAPVIAALDQGLLVAGPSDTVYGLLGRADRDPAWERLRAVKGRDGLFLALVRDADQARAWAVVPPGLGERLSRVWPGPVTVILPSGPAAVGRFGPTIALRCPKSPFLEALLREIPSPLLSTSANAPGEPPPLAVEGVEPLVAHLAMVVDGGPAKVDRPSTIVDLTGHQPRLVRDGSGDPGALLDPEGSSL
jgi:L-threonylcarbamoyladenylate synthase